MWVHRKTYDERHVECRQQSLKGEINAVLLNNVQRLSGTLSSTLSESSFSTSFLILRSMKGFRIMCSLESWSEKRSTMLHQQTRRPLKSTAALTLVNGRLVFRVALDVLGKPLAKLLVGVEQRGHDEV